MGETGLLLLFFVFVLTAVCSACYFVLNRTSALPEAASSKEVLTETFRSLGDSLPRSRTAQIRSMLIAAGYRSPDAVSTFNGIAHSAALLAGSIGAAFSYFLNPDALATLLFGVAVAGLTLMLSKRVLNQMGKARAQRINSGLPTALDMLVLSVEAGQSLDQSIFDASRELRLSFPDLADELTQVYLSLRANTTRAQVFREFGDRNPHSELRKLATLLIDSDRFGATIGPALRTHAKYLRVRRRQAAQEQARKVSTKLVFPIFFLIFPAVLVVTLGPAIIQLRESFFKFMAK